MPKIEKITLLRITCEGCGKKIDTEKTEGKVQCKKCGHRTDIS